MSIHNAALSEQEVTLTKAAVVLVLLAVLAGCASSKDDVRRTCPKITVLGDASRITRFAPGLGRDLTDVDFEAQFADVLMRCEYVGDREDGDLAVVVALAPVIAASRGPANKSQNALLDYFVSVVDQGKNILRKQHFSVDVPFTGNRSQVVLQDDTPPISVNLPLPNNRHGSAYQIYLGFQLSENELDYNRRRTAGLR
ncbi:MAG: hypothetical protein KIT00_05615 [Rhodospirillales bacterium]|nr:hypothetical protein [Rhodospirillales bacterium]